MTEWPVPTDSNFVVILCCCESNVLGWKLHIHIVIKHACDCVTSIWSRRYTASNTIVVFKSEWVFIKSCHGDKTFRSVSGLMVGATFIFFPDGLIISKSPASHDLEFIRLDDGGTNLRRRAGHKDVLSFIAIYVFHALILHRACRYERSRTFWMRNSYL